MKTINMTREGLYAISTLIEKSPYLSQILDGGSHFTENCDWSFDDVNNRQSYKLHLPEDKLDILKFLFKVELQKNASRFWETHYKNKDAEKMLKRIIKSLNKQG